MKKSIAIYNGQEGTILEDFPHHGSPADRGSADRYYGRPFDPHYWPQGTLKGARVEQSDMTLEQIIEYTNAFQNETERKNWY